MTFVQAFKSLFYDCFDIENFSVNSLKNLHIDSFRLPTNEQTNNVTVKNLFFHEHVRRPRGKLFVTVDSQHFWITILPCSKWLLILVTGAIIHRRKDYQDLQQTGACDQALPTINRFI